VGDYGVGVGVLGSNHTVCPWRRQIIVPACEKDDSAQGGNTLVGFDGQSA